MFTQQIGRVLFAACEFMIVPPVQAVLGKFLPHNYN